MTEYKVEADEIVGLKGAKYKKGSKVREEFFPPGHVKYLEEIKAISKIESKNKKGR